MLVELKGIQKRFGGVQALSDGNLSVDGGEAHLLLHDGGHLALGADRSRSIQATRRILEHYSPAQFRYVTVDSWA